LDFWELKKYNAIFGILATQKFQFFPKTSHPACQLKLEAYAT
jgi:hypothetical protein